MRFGKLVLLLMLLIFSINFVSGVQVRFQLGSVQDDCDVLGVGSACSGGDGATIWVVNLDTWNTVCLSNQDTTLSLTPGTYIASIASYPDNNAVEAKISVIGDGYVNNIKEIKTSTQWKDCMTAGTCVSNYDSLPYARLKNGICTSNPLLSDVADRIGSAGIDWVRVGYKFRVSTCPDNQVIMRLSSTTNAHGEVWNGASNYPNEICYDEIFGSQGNGIRTCSGTNKVLGLSDVTNAHAEKPENTAYTTPVCYGDLVCTARSVCNLDERMVVSLSADTNAHLEASGSYDVKICCKVGILGQRYWADMDDENIQINTAEVKDSVKLVWKNTGLAEGSIVSFEIFEDDLTPLPDAVIRKGTSAIPATVNSMGDAVGVWEINQTDYDLGNNLLDCEFCSDNHEEFYFSVSGGDSNDLYVSDTENNALPTAKIDKPAATDTLEKRSFLKGAIVDFKQISEDADDDLKVNWSFDDGTTTGFENCLTGNNCNTSHTYTEKGARIVKLTAQEMARNQTATDYSRIYIYDQGINVFAVITSPDPTKTAEENQFTDEINFDGQYSFVAECLLTCLAGKTCYQVSDGITTLYCYILPKTVPDGPTGYNLIFNWTFDKGIERAGEWISSSFNVVVNFAIRSFNPGNHWTKLKVGYEQGTNIIWSEQVKADFSFYKTELGCYYTEDRSMAWWQKGTDREDYSDEAKNCYNVDGINTQECCPDSLACNRNTGICDQEVYGCGEFSQEDCDGNANIAITQLNGIYGEGYCTGDVPEAITDPSDPNFGCNKIYENCRCKWNDADGECKAISDFDYINCPNPDNDDLIAYCQTTNVQTTQEGEFIHQSWDAYYLDNSNNPISCASDDDCANFDSTFTCNEKYKCISSPGCEPGERRFISGETELPFFGIFQFIGALILVFLFYFIKERKFKEKK